MRFEVLATDYDGTLARHATVDASTIAAVERLKASGRRAFLVTGREIEDLRQAFPRLDLFDVIVGENGALIYHPSTGAVEVLHEPPPKAFVDELRRRNVTPLSVGHVIIATMEPNESIVAEVVQQFGLDLRVIFNKGSVMILPPAVNKASGLREALRRAGISPSKVVGIGDAENDFSLLACCGFGVAVDNALPSLKEKADFITRSSHGQGVTELIELIISTDLVGIARKVAAPAT